MIKISVIVPVYSVPAIYLRACLDSLVAQTMSECEFVVVSDGASKVECSICEEYAAKDSRFKFFQRGHAGVSATRNYGMEQVRGEYIAFLDSDDRISKDFCSTIWENLLKWNSDILLFEQIIDCEKNISARALFNEDVACVSDIQYRDLLRRVYYPRRDESLVLIRTCCQAYRAAFIKEKKLQFDSDLNYSEDQFFNLNAFLKTHAISYLANHPIYIQTSRNNSLSNSYKPGYEKEVCSYLNRMKIMTEMHPDLIEIKLFYNRVIQCILYTLDKSIFCPNPKLTFFKRRKIFNNFFDNPLYAESLSFFDKNNFTFPERILCFLCKYRLFVPLLIISKKWHVQRMLGK